MKKNNKCKPNNYILTSHLAHFSMNEWIKFNSTSTPNMLCCANKGEMLNVRPKPKTTCTWSNNRQT